MRPVLLLGLALTVAACAPHKPGNSDAGAVTDAHAEEDASTPCVGDYASCGATSTCCTTGFVCNPSTRVCQAACLPVQSLCSQNSDCCSGLCNGTCQ